MKKQTKGRTLIDVKCFSSTNPYDENPSTRKVSPKKKKTCGRGMNVWERVMGVKMGEGRGNLNVG